MPVWPHVSYLQISIRSPQDGVNTNWTWWKMQQSSNLILKPDQSPQTIALKEPFDVCAALIEMELHCLKCWAVLSSPPLTILLFLRQDGNLLSSGQIKQKQHSLLPNDVGEVHIVHLQEAAEELMSAY